MLSHIVKLEHAVNDKVGLFLCDNDTPVVAAREMLFHFAKYLDQIEEHAKAQQAQMPVPDLPVQDHLVKEEFDEKTIVEGQVA